MEKLATVAKSLFANTCNEKNVIRQRHDSYSAFYARHET